MMKAASVSAVALFLIACGTADGTGDSDVGGSDVGNGDVSVDTENDVDTDTTPEPDVHREVGETCDDERSMDGPFNTSEPQNMQCATHADCTEGANGRCSDEARFPGTYCTYDECFSDDDCGGNACVCGGGSAGNNVCVTGECATDGDCGLNGYCSPTLGGCGPFGGTVGYFCHGELDTCTNDSDCDETSPEGYCRYFEDTGAWACATGQCDGK